MTAGLKKTLSGCALGTALGIMALSSNAFAACDMETAGARFGALGDAMSQAAMQGQLTDAQLNSARVTELSTALNNALTAGQYDRVCELVPLIAQELNLTLPQ